MEEDDWFYIYSMYVLNVLVLSQFEVSYFNVSLQIVVDS